jgi:hypothetical protein
MQEDTILIGKKTLGRPSRRWEDNMKMELRETETEGLEWIKLAQDRNTVMNLRFP